ncbi:NADH:ubiquinone oxidoreductase subunit 5 (chain L)/Multisubunit Na+/H+ antiporter, MnhA subunit [Modicisalibacter ilicicola DSM 19980]|uniref:NADH:ubiquinone oxidoreductase subunit 5 (Chain L)/Multisubunit Na+/H+ antiporter, MnhA subunit n=1 Tax=Modicisalibacter ilicicola DSM 19980 TaxID=1121942 RepID=A0A1M5DMU4_9GAMM|nr:proton-conducting transporter membrane subunit [Halomonas ilicicola]SHF68293.1 NADH:ubiquinone oxidoreductase subunit 5 (chain L)/Multisubunit Na+/H+ antiporter, MnhA subunit [Halomonas ilicicola DSM 19980]
MLWTLALFPLLGATLLYLGGRHLSRGGLALAAALVLLVTLGLAGLAVTNDWQGGHAWSETLVLTLELSTAGSVFALTIPLIALPIVVYAGYHEVALRTGYRRGSRQGARLIGLLLGFVGAMQLLVLAGDFLTLLIAWELVGACSWALISHKWGQAEVPKEAVQAFLVTRFGDLGLYIAAAAVFAGTGGFGYADLAALDGDLLSMAVAGILLAAAAKSAQLPFSSWLFAAMAGPVPVSALLHSATMVAAGIYLLSRLQPVLSAVDWFAPLVIGLGLATALAGGVVGAFQDHAKKLLAASTSAQYGLMWVAVGAGFPGVALLHFVAHAFLKAGLFLAAGLAERQTGSYDLRDMRQGSRLPGIALATAVPSLALAGVIPLGAAWSKEQIAAAAGHQAAWLAVLVVLAGGLSALYATRFQLLAYGRPLRRDPTMLPQGPRPSRAESGALVFLAGVTLLLSLAWWPGAQTWLAEALPRQLPEGKPWELILSLALVVLGIAVGFILTRRRRRLSAWESWASTWFGLPAVIQGVAMGALLLGRALARFDDRVVDAGLRGTARFGQWLARRHAREGEAFAEGVPGMATRLSEWGGRWARQAQSGQTHHYYAGISLGLVVIFAILLIGALL